MVFAGYEFYDTVSSWVFVSGVVEVRVPQNNEFLEWTDTYRQLGENMHRVVEFLKFVYIVKLYMSA
jgi:hypothetical protein